MKNNFKARILLAKEEKSRPNMATLITQLVGSKRVIFWEVLDTKGADKGPTRVELLGFIKHLLEEINKNGLFLSSEQFKKDANGNGPTALFDKNGYDIVKDILSTKDFKLSLKY